MILKFRAIRVRLLALIPILLVSIAACDQTRQQIANVIQPSSPETIITSVNEKISIRLYAQAYKEGADFLKGQKDPTGRLVLALAKASAQIAQKDQAILYIEQALKAGAITSEEAMMEPLLEPLRDDIRFVSLLAGTTPQAGARAAPATSIEGTVPIDTTTSVTIDAKGIEARAGNVSVKLPD